MRNPLLTKAFSYLKKHNIDSFYIQISNENIYEFTKRIDNQLIDLTGFTGDTGSMLINKNKAFLFVDGRFTHQAKKEIKDDRIIVLETNSTKSKLDKISLYTKKSKNFGFNPKLVSIDFANKLHDSNKKLKFKFDDKFLKNEFETLNNSRFKLSCSPLFLLDQKYVSHDTKFKISAALKNLKDESKRNFTYITSNLEEIAYLTNLRFRFSDISDYSVLFDSFLIINNNSSTLYIKDYLEEDAYNYIKKNNILINKYEEFYNDLSLIKGNIYLDPKINNYYIYLKLKNNKNVSLVESPIAIDKSIKESKEISGLRKSNIIDGVAITKAIYKIKKYFVDGIKNGTALKNEYDVKKLVDSERKIVGKQNFLSNSFETIVAFKENSAICHYVPNEKKSKKINSDGLLLIDSGGNYLFGTTDITRTISLYKNKIPDEIKKHYSLVLNSMLSVANLRFPSGLTGVEIDIVARKNLYDEHLDFNHGTGHGIGYISNVHEGTNSISPGINNKSKTNELLVGQVLSDEPGLYFENKYGIRIENDLLVAKDKENEFGSFLKFETLTLCPFDLDLVDLKYIDKKNLDFLNSYNKAVYNKLSKKLDKEEREWLLNATRELKYDD